MPTASSSGTICAKHSRAAIISREGSLADEGESCGAVAVSDSVTSGLDLLAQTRHADHEDSPKIDWAMYR